MRDTFSQLLQTNQWFVLCMVFMAAMLVLILFVAREAWHYRNMTIKSKKRYYESRD